MESTRYLIIGAGMSGLSFANFIDSNDYLVLERDQEIGGYCKTVTQDGFVWDYSGHFFHFKHKDIEKYLRDRLPPSEVRTIHKKSAIFYKGEYIDFPFQKNIHQLPQDEFIDCLYDLYFKEDKGDPQNFQEMVRQRFGNSIAEKFLIPYNEKLYACELDRLDADAMGRFFPYADLDAIIRNFRAPDNSSYNSSFTYPTGGAIRYVQALMRDLSNEKVRLGCSLLSVDLKEKIATTSQGDIKFEHIISSAPFDRLLQMANLEHSSQTFQSNKVLVFNLGFDKKGPTGLHWLYFPEKRFSFYRVGFYDNIFNTDRMSLYVEIGASTDEVLDPPAALKQVLLDLKTAGIIEDHQLVSHHTVTLDPAYVHITQDSVREVSRLKKVLGVQGVHSIGRYGGWTYCSIEDNMLEAKALAETFNTLPY